LGVIAAICSLLLCGALFPAAAAAKSAPRPAYWGAWIGDQLTGQAAPWDMGTVERFEQLVGKGMSLVEFSSPFSECDSGGCHGFQFPAPQMEAIRQHGSIPVLSWGSEIIPRDSAQQPDAQLSDVIEGRYDSYIGQFAAEAAAWGHPFFLRFDWEMNGDWLPWSEQANGNSPGQFIAAWRHVHDIFAAAGATNATWVWCPYADEKNKYPSMKRYYPGSRYVDWTGLDAYNWGQNPVNPQRWKSFGKLFAGSYAKLTKSVAPRKPVMIAEFASTPNGGNKGLWIRNMFAKLPSKYPRVRALIWFDTVDRGVDWPIETSAAATRAFSAGIRGERYASNSFSELPPGPVLPLR
jgi:mannan endo-1,4-beta-mannosidase